MEHPFFATSAATGSSNAATTPRSEALRWLAIGEKLLAGRDLVGSKSFASRARESDPTLLYADQIIAVADTLLASDKRINNTPDWYAVLQLSPEQTLTEELVSNQYRKLALLLNPSKNKLPFADQAYALIANAWQVLSNPSKKLMYDNELVNHFRVNNPNPSPVGAGYNPFSPGILREQQHQQQPHHQQQFNYQPYEINFQVMQSQHPPPPLQPQPQHLHHAAMESREHQMFQQQQRGFREPPPSMMVPQLHLTPEAINQHTFQQNVNRHSHVQQQTPPQPQPQPQHPAQYQPQPQPQPQQQYRNEEIPGNHVTHNLTHNFSGLFGDSSNNENADNANAMPNNDDNYNHSENGDEIENGEGEDGDQENAGNSDAGNEGGGVEETPEDGGSTFWTACPYCYYMFEYPSIYEDCALKCQNCKKVFQGLMIASPPPVVDGQEAYFCCWGMMPMGVSMNVVERNQGNGGTWTPFSPMFSCSKGNGSGGGYTGSWGGFGPWNNGTGGPSGGNLGNHNPGGGGGSGGYNGGRKNKSSGPRVYIDDDDVFLEYSDPSGAEDDGDWRSEKTKKKAKTAKKPNGAYKKRATKISGTPGKRGRGRPPKVSKVVDTEVSGNENSVPEGIVVQEGTTAVEANKKGTAPVVRRHSARVAKELGRLDLNVEFNNEGEESAAPRVSQANGTGRGEEDIIEGSAFFEGLDEFLSTLPILNAVGDDKIKAA